MSKSKHCGNVVRGMRVPRVAIFPEKIRKHQIW